jgi:hypothetical protein
MYSKLPASETTPYPASFVKRTRSTLSGAPDEPPRITGLTTGIRRRCSQSKNERYSCARWRDGLRQARRRPSVTSCSTARGGGWPRSRNTRSSTRPRRIQRSPGRLTPLLENVRCGGGGTGPRSARQGHDEADPRSCRLEQRVVELAPLEVAHVAQRRVADDSLDAAAQRGARDEFTSRAGSRFSWNRAYSRAPRHIAA